ncbi:hypothetical protein DPSP01_014013 [Paraphaeosphaeria sporulosa]
MAFFGTIVHNWYRSGANWHKQPTFVLQKRLAALEDAVAAVVDITEEVHLRMRKTAHEKRVAFYDAAKRTYDTQLADPKYIAAPTGLQPGEFRLMRAPVEVPPFNEAEERASFNEDRNEANKEVKRLAERILAELGTGNKGYWEVAQAHNGAIHQTEDTAESGVLIQGRSRSKAALKKKRKLDEAEDESDEDGVSPSKAQMVKCGYPRGTAVTGFAAEQNRKRAEEQAKVLARVDITSPTASASAPDDPASPTPAGNKRSRNALSGTQMATISPFSSESDKVKHFNAQYHTKRRSKSGICKTDTGRAQWLRLFPHDRV